MVFDTSLLNIQQYKVRVKGKAEQSRERRSAFPTPRSSSYWKGSLLVTLQYGHQLYFFMITFELIHLGKAWNPFMHQAIIRLLFIYKDSSGIE